MLHPLRAVLLAAWFLLPADLTQAQIWDLADKAKTAEEVAALEPAVAKLDATWRVRRAIDLSMAWMRLRRWDDAQRVLDDNRAAAAAKEVVLLDEMKVVILRVEGRDDDAITAARRLLETIAKDPKSSSWNTRVANRMHRELAGIHQRLGRWREALAEHQLWEPDSHCGTCDAEDDAEKKLDIARCQFGLGRVDEALATSLAVATDEWGRRSDAVALFVEQAARSGRLDAARRRLADVEPEVRRRADLPVRLAVAWAARDAAAILDENAAAFDVAKMQIVRWDALRLAASFLADLGKPGEERLAARVANGDLAAASLAAIGAVQSALPAVRARRDAAKLETERQFLDWAVQSIEAAARR